MRTGPQSTVKASAKQVVSHCTLKHKRRVISLAVQAVTTTIESAGIKALACPLDGTTAARVIDHNRYSKPVKPCPSLTTLLSGALFRIGFWETLAGP